MSERTDFNDDDLLAAEYALGVLDASEKEAVEARLSEPAFAAAVERWRYLFAEFLVATEETAPPAALKARIMGRLFAARAPRRASSFLESLAFWRMAATFSAALAAVAVLFAVIAGSGLVRGGGYTLVASLAPPETPMTLTARINTETGVIEIIDASLEEALRSAEQTTELWLIPEDGTPRSLGLIDGVGASRVRIPAALRSLVEAGAVLAVSIEPVGGSPTGAPTGPVIALGPIRPHSGD